MSVTDTGRAMRVVSADGWPGGPRIIEGLHPSNCIHGRPLRSQNWGGTHQTAREQLCRLCEYEAPRFAKVSSR